MEKPKVDFIGGLSPAIAIEQKAVSRNPRSTVGTVAEVYDYLRVLFARVGTPHCPECGREVRAQSAQEIVEQVASLPGGTRFQVLDMDVEEALDFFTNVPKVRRILQTLVDVGLGYVKLGQSATTLSGGEAQRVKLAKELARVSTGDTAYILDKPTTGLHFADIQKLLDVLHRLTDAGNSVIVIEHNLDVIKTADWIIDLGPEGGDAGGYIVAQGLPEAVAQVKESDTGQFLTEMLKRELKEEVT